MTLNTHLNIDTSLCGRVVKLSEGYAEVLLHTTQQMSADEYGLVHGGFIFGAADFAAMCAVNDPLVVLGASESKFILPVKSGDTLLFKASLASIQKKKHFVKVEAFVSQKLVFVGSFTTFILEKHPLLS